MTIKTIITGVVDHVELARFFRRVKAWANSVLAPKNHTHTKSEITDFGSYVTTGQVGASNGVAPLNSGKIPTQYLPSYVDDVVELEAVTNIEPYVFTAELYYYNTSSHKLYKSVYGNKTFLWTETPVEDGKIYVNKADNKTYRWSGSDMVEISASLALGETSGTAYRGDHGKAAYDHSQDATRTGTAASSGLYKVAITSNGHIASETAVVKADLTALGVEDASNKVTAFGVTPSDTNYPSEKLVKDSLDYLAVVIIKKAELTQAQYDALVQAGTVDANTLYIIT